MPSIVEKKASDCTYFRSLQRPRRMIDMVTYGCTLSERSKSNL
jgi:hypothetical protein